MAGMGQRRGAYRVMVGKPWDATMRIILKLFFKIQDQGQGNASSGSRQEMVTGSHKHGNKPWLHKVQEFLD